ncbi:SDR family NAD(P)-dependent oxidoreductase [Pleionea sediminis]|uniref:SDR family NAD(P)-dependent oxidoreductase n=1 Tax=Pleionea sediminis TaxID=2569479 RepID=UPI0011858DF5|nr:SDR family NAD(P)-dependent oxidoreductase [Pleionea sediminis]
MSELNGKTVLLTGASSGIGEALVEKLIARGARVIGVARSEDKLQALSEKHGDFFESRTADLSEQQGWSTLVESLNVSPDIVVLNAGTCEYLEAGSIDIGLVERVFEVNFFANVRGAKVLLDKYQDSLKQFVVVSSSARYLAMPRGEAYGASKAALTYFFESLQLSFPNIRFSMVHPGFVKTPLTDKNDFDMPMRITAEEAALVMANKIEKGKLQINFPLVFTLLMRILGMLPASLRYKLGRGMVKK